MLFETAYKRALSRDKNAKVLQVVDILGPPPSPENVPDLQVVLNEFDRMTGLEAVKMEMRKLVQLAATNYQRVLDGQSP